MNFVFQANSFRSGCTAGLLRQQVSRFFFSICLRPFASFAQDLASFEPCQEPTLAVPLDATEACSHMRGCDDADSSIESHRMYLGEHDDKSSTESLSADVAMYNNALAARSGGLPKAAENTPNPTKRASTTVRSERQIRSLLDRRCRCNSPQIRLQYDRL